MVADLDIVTQFYNVPKNKLGLAYILDWCYSWSHLGGPENKATSGCEGG